MGIKRMLPPDCSADIHQIIAKAIYFRAHNGSRQATLPCVISREELEIASDAEFGYEIDDDGALTFRPLTEDEKQL